MKKLIFLSTVFLLVSGLNLMANKTSVSVKGPSTAKKGTEVTIIIDVTHKGNSKMHYTDWVTLKLNGKEIKKWEFTKEKLPEAQDFKLEYKMVLTEDGTFEAQGHCNLHGSAGAKTLSVKIN
jgi:desulfoferrodoxin (superoxide reductase-like protein)